MIIVIFAVKKTQVMIQMLITYVIRYVIKVYFLRKIWTISVNAGNQMIIIILKSSVTINLQKIKTELIVALIYVTYAVMLKM